MDNNQKIYSVTMTEQEIGGRATTYLVGTFDSRDKAKQALDDVFNKVCDVYSISDKTLQNEREVDVDTSYYNEDEFSFDYMTISCNEVAGNVSAEITEHTINEVLIHTQID